MVGGMIHVLFREIIISQNASGILLCSFCSQESCKPSIKYSVASLFLTATISKLQVWLESSCCTPFHEVGLACVSFVLGMPSMAGAVFGIISHQCSVSSDALVFPIGWK